MEAKLDKSTRKNKKLMVKIDGKTIHFGSKNSETFLNHKDKEKKENYISRHSKLNEDWNKSGIKTAGFWSKWLLWNKKTLKDSIKDIEKRFNVKIKT